MNENDASFMFNAGYEAGALSMKEEIDSLRAENKKLRDLVKRANKILTKDIYTFTFLESVASWLKDAEEKSE